MTLEVLASGALGALLVFFLAIVRDARCRSRRISANWQAIRGEVSECGRIALGYRDEAITEQEPSDSSPQRVVKLSTPLFRLPTICYSSAFPALITEGAITGDEADALLKFYSQVDTINRGLDQAETKRQTGRIAEEVQPEVKRLVRKCGKVAADSGGQYQAAMEAIESGEQRVSFWSCLF